jgi:signal transduction histidine kinase
MSQGLGKRRLLWRVYLYGVLMLLLSAGASVAVGHYVLQPAYEIPVRPSTTWIAWHIAAISHEPERVRTELADLRERVGIEVSVFEPTGKLVVSSVSVPPQPLAKAALDTLLAQGTSFQNGRGRVAIRDRAGKLESYVLMRYPEASPFGIALGQFAVALLVLTLLAIPLARSIALPVEQLAHLTRAFGRGNFALRAGPQRRRDEIGDLARAFDEMADRLAALRRAELELLANVSHELRTPLSRIQLALELVRDGDTQRVNVHLDDIAEELLELEQLIDDVMTTTRLDLAQPNADEGLPPLHRQRVPGHHVLEASASRFRKKHPERELYCAYGDDLPELNVDPMLVRRALDNLIDNAAKFSEADTPVELQAAPSSSGLDITVVDRGMGIGDDDKPRIFEAFYRADKSRARATGGVGLGLALAKRIVEAHGGSVDFTSKPGTGSRFVVHLPRAG